MGKHNAEKRWLSVTSGDVNAFYTRAIADQQITYIVEFGGLLDIERLEKSTALLLEKIPVLRSVIRVNGLRLKREPLYQDNNTIPVADIADDPRETIIQFVSTPCNPETELPLKLLIIRSGGSDTLCVKIDHVASDAGGLKYMLYLLSDAYTNGSISLPVNQNRSMSQIYRRFSMVKLLRTGLKANMPSPGTPLIKGPFAPDDFFIERAAISPEMFEMLRIKAKEHNATINDLILAAVYQTIFEHPTVEAGKAYPIMVPIDMRRYLEANRRGMAANFSSLLFPALKKTENEGFADTLRQVSACMNRYKNNLPGLGIAVTVSLGACFARGKIKTTYETAASYESGFINITNFGIIDDRLLRFDNVTVKGAYGIGPFQSAPAMIIAVSTFQGTLDFTVQGSDRQKVQPFVKAFLAGMIDKLNGFVGED
jgi:NRPS condensation-like uncharacterized protein